MHHHLLDTLQATSFVWAVSNLDAPPTAQSSAQAPCPMQEAHVDEGDNANQLLPAQRCAAYPVPLNSVAYCLGDLG